MQKDPAQVIFSWLGIYICPEIELIAVQRGNAVVTKSSKKSRIESNFQLFELLQSDFDNIEEIARKEGEIRFGDWDKLWGSKLFASDRL